MYGGSRRSRRSSAARSPRRVRPTRYQSRWPLHDLERALVDRRIGLCEPEVARRQKAVESAREPERGDAIAVELARLVVEREHAIPAGARDVVEHRERLVVRLRLALHERDELGARERARPIEHDAIEEAIERDRRAVEIDREGVVALLEPGVERELLDREAARIVIPTVRQQHAADVEEHDLGLSHRA